MIDGAAQDLTLPHIAATGGRIGPNAILQRTGVLMAEGGLPLRDRVLAEAGVTMPPADAGV